MLSMDYEKELSLGELLKVQNNVEKKVGNRPGLHEIEFSKKKSKKRINKNRPREQSSKNPDTMFQMDKKKKIPFRDPRFDNLCGTYNEKFFRDSYGFLVDIKQKEKEELEKTLKKETDPTTRQQIKFLLKRIKDQERENERKNAKLNKKAEQRERLKMKLLEGKSVHFKTKSEKKLSDLVERYEELKSKGKVKSYIKKKVKKSVKNSDAVPYR